MARTFAVGDVHGMEGLLNALLRELLGEVEPGDRLVFLGDLIDRGPGSRAVLDRVLELQAGAWPGPVICLRGNHEAELLTMLDGRLSFENWLDRMDGEATVRSYTAVLSESSFRDRLPTAHRSLLESTRLWHRDEHGIYVHAGLVPGLEPEETPERVLLWGHLGFMESDHRWDRLVVFGHTPQYEGREKGPVPLRLRRYRPLVRPEKMGIDTGSGCGGHLATVRLPEQVVLTAQ